MINKKIITPKGERELIISPYELEILKEDWAILKPLVEECGSCPEEIIIQNMVGPIEFRIEPERIVEVLEVFTDISKEYFCKNCGKKFVPKSRRATSREHCGRCDNANKRDI